MNKLILIFFLSINFSAFGQIKLNGNYQTSFKDNNYPSYKAFTFFKNGTFEYADSDPAFYFIEGKGNYTIKNDKIELRFIGYEPLANSFVIENKSCNNPEEENLTFTIIDKETQKPFSNANIELMLKHSRKVIMALQTDENGNSDITEKIINEFRDSTIVVFAQYYNDYGEHSKVYSFELKLTSCKKINIALVLEPHSFNRKVAAGEVWEYKLKDFKDEKGKGIIFQIEPSSPNSKSYNEFFYKYKIKKKR